MKKLYYLICIACALVANVSTAKADDLRGPEGGYVNDPDVMVAPGSYFAISSVYNGHRYYLGVDTTAAKSGTYQVTTYDSPCFAAMWRVGGLYSPTGATLDSKDYQRMYKSVYLLEKHTQEAWLTLSGDGKTTLSLATDSAAGTFFHSDKTRAAKGRYVEGSIYYYSDATGMDTYRYLAYDALYGYSKVYSVPRPTSTMWATIWGRAQGDNLSCIFNAASYPIGYKTLAETINYSFTLRLEEGGDRFKSLYDGTEFYAFRPTITDNQSTLNSIVTLSADWASRKGKPNSNKSYFTTKETYDDGEGEKERPKDSLMMTIGSVSFDGAKFNGTLTTAGASPINLFDTLDRWVNHQDYLHLHMTCSSKSISSFDSALVIRRLYRANPYKDLKLSHLPFDHTFPYFDEDSLSQPYIATQHKDQQDFTVSATYLDGAIIVNTNGFEVENREGSKIVLHIDERPCYRDTVWTDNEHTSYSAIHLLDTLMATAYKIDGVTKSDWIDTIYLPTLNTIRVVAKPYSTGSTDYRQALIKYTYTYRHSSVKGDTIRAEGYISVMQAPQDQSSAPVAFSHQRGKSGLPMVGEFSRQQVPELTYTYYVIPDTTNYLPVHHDHWGYYRWFIYKKGSNRGKGISNNWQWDPMPTDKDYVNFQQINNADSKWSRGLFAMRSRFTPGVATNVPAVRLDVDKLGGTTTNFDDTLGVDISAYTDTIYREVSATHKELTEPTLSYRQLCAMRPAYESAERMKNNLINGGNYLQEEACFAPINRPFRLQPTSPYKLDNISGEGNLQYVYYYNPSTTDTLDRNMGTTAGGLDVTKGSSYNRVGLGKKTGDLNYHARLITVAEINAMRVGDTIDVVMVNPRKSSGYIVGKESSSTSPEPYNDGFSNNSSAEDLRKYIEKNIMTDGTKPYLQPKYALKLTKVANNTLRVVHTQNNEPLTIAYFTILITRWWYLDWTLSGHRASGHANMEYSTPSSWSDGDRISDLDNALIKLHLQTSYSISSINGYLTACDYTAEGWFTPEKYEANLHVANNNASEGADCNQAWCFYEIIKPTSILNHQEYGKWQRKTPNDATWKDNGDGWNGTELDGGALQVTESTCSSGDTIGYRLVTQHFQLAHFTVKMRPAEGAGAQGPSTTALISEQQIEENYDILASFQLEEQLGAPGTSEMVSPFHHLQFNHTQFAYHYPVGTAEHEIPAAQRVTGDDILPGKGEYCIINKFENASSDYAVVEAGGGAEHGWMFCYNRANRPLVFIDFTYPKPACTDQDLVLVANFCQPNKVSQENPHIKAEYYGHRAGRPDDEWEIIFTYLTGNLTAAGQWYQLALPLRWSEISGYDMYRCVGTVSAAEGDGAYLLFDRFRLLGKRHAVTGFQKRTTCVDANDSIYILSRVDYTDSELPAGRVICYQFQKWDNSANGGAGGYVPMITSDYDSGTGTYTCRPLNTTEVYPGYYKVGMNREEAVTNPAFKSAVLNSDYGMIVIPENEYNPANSGTSAGWSPARVAAINRIQEILGGDRSSYKNETGRIKTYSDIMTATTFHFDGQGKFYVNEGTNANPHWVMYIIVRVKASDSDNGSFRIAMNTVSTVDQKPNFSSASCSNERIVRVQGSVDMLVDGNDSWPNKTRTELAALDELIPANTPVTIGLRYNAPADAKAGTTTACRFDLLRAFDFMRGYTEMTPEQQAAADLQWLGIYGCEPGDFQEAMNVFRAEDVNNPNRNVYDWNDVTKESFRWIPGYDEAKADSMYNLLNRLIVRDRLFEIGLSSRDVYMANKQDLYYYIRPIAASGSYTKLLTNPERDTIVEGIICNAALWVELHSAESPDSLRFGYDKKFGDSYMIPIIRATKTAANTALTVRVATISDHAVIGWDSTYVVDTNDPTWNPATHTFRYTQDRILQERLYSGYYKQDEVVTFRPVDAAHITRLNRTDCECLNYDAAGTTYDPANPRAKDTSGDNVFIRPGAGPISGCNEWHVLPQTSDPDPKKRIPGYQVPNNFTLKAGYWYKFKTSFFNNSAIVPYNMGDNPSGANAAYFILAVVPDTVRWTPHYTDRTNYWNDDNNWTAVVNKQDFNGSLATVPLEDTRTIIEPLEDQSYLPVVNYDSLGLKEWGFKTATCKDILFKHNTQILGQEKLTYTGKAFIDVPIRTGNWQTYSPALKYVYSGDIYIPRQAGKAANSNVNNPYDPDFAPAPFNDGSGWTDNYNRNWPYAFYQAYYNTSVNFAFQNTDKDGALDTETKSPKNSAEWVKTNVLDQPLTPGKAVALLGFGPTDVEDSMLVVRLPKQEKGYRYIGKKNGVWTAGDSVTVRTVERDAITANLAYDKATLGESDGVTYTLTNALESNVFFFGNPTMSLIDVYRLCEDNKDLLEYTEGATNSYSFTTYNMKDGSTYNTEVVNAPGKYFIAPQRAIGLIAASPRTTLNIKLKPSALVALSSGGTIVHNIDPGAKKAEVARMATAEALVKDKLLYIAASNETNKGLYKAYITLGESSVATRGFRKGEDAISLSSGSTYYNSTAFATPLSMYTIADNQPLMLDMRDSIFSVPLVFATLDTVTNANGVRVWSKYRFDNITRLSFALEGNWDKTLYLYDALTGDSLMIVNGLQVGVQTPESDQIRYFINGGRRIQTPVVPDPVDPGVVTGMENVNGENNSRLNNNHSTIIYDILGRRMRVLGEYDLLQNVNLPTGVYILQRGDQTEKIVVR